VNLRNDLRLRRELGARLRRHRETMGWSGESLGKSLGRSQSWVSKVELGKIAIDEEDLQRWIDATNPGAPAEADLRDLWSRGQAADYEPWSAHAGGATANQASIGELEATCVLLAEFQPVLVPGLLQTAAYAMDVVFAPGGPVAEGTDPDDAAGIVQRRMQRQQILWTFGSGKTFKFAILAAALTTQMAGPDAMRGQLAHLAALCEGGPPGLTIGIIPPDVRVPIAPTSGFALYDTDLAVLEGPDGGTWQISDPLAVANYYRLLDLVLDVAVTGSEAAALCRRAAATGGDSSSRSNIHA
jgi:transcriptional regulator with XRE-family HTH domain